jgi:ParB-like chromosome segregation protein Spo0J
MNVEIWPIDRLQPYQKNPRQIPQSAIDKVAKSLQAFGFRQPIVVDSKGVIVVGHTRLLAAKQLGMIEVPVHVAENLTPAQLKQYRLADNRTHEEAAWDTGLLVLELTDLQDLKLDLDLTGFDLRDLDSILNGNAEPIPESENERAPKLLFIQLTPDQKQVIDMAVAKVRDDQQDQSISEGRACELICGDYLSGA